MSIKLKPKYYVTYSIKLSAANSTELSSSEAFSILCSVSARNISDLVCASGTYAREFRRPSKAARLVSKIAPLKEAFLGRRICTIEVVISRYLSLPTQLLGLGGVSNSKPWISLTPI